MSMLSNVPTAKIMALPGPVKALLMVFSGTSVLTIAYFMLGDSPNKGRAMAILTGGIILVCILVLAFQMFVKWSQKRKANPMAMGIAGNAAAAPQGISEPARRARLDDLRRNFEQGVEKFRAAGKNLYSVPWYVLVGEPGSGKTEAIRHCNVGFPPGLQDQLQGAGGTLNMNWWFTNSAIILDTAGRLMFEEVVPGSTNEWAEFLKLLKQNRPNSPVNGLLLVIPVDTLIKDSSDAIEKKATKIAQQFEQIQRTLGVRFPVFVIITKCDLLNGFREFFDDLNDPQLQHQIMGWSNPSPLDERFDPALVTNHLETVRQRLASRRQNLLLDPVNTEDPQGRRVDQVDALYELPDSVTRIGPRLRRYLEMIFVAGEWSPKPLFLRGIYFTSSMTEGAALDDELAKVLGVPVDSLPGGAIFRKDRAYFLRDLFLEKVFREKGLVTRAGNADKQQRTRRMMVLGAGFFAVIVLFLVTWLGSRGLKRSIGNEAAFWKGVAEIQQEKNPIIQTTPVVIYKGDSPVKIGSGVEPIAQVFAKNLDKVRNDIAIPVVFKPMTAISSDLNQQRRIAYRALYESLVLRPAFTAAREKMTAEEWDPHKGPAALAELMKIEYTLNSKKLPAGPNPQVKLSPLFDATLPAEEYAKFAKDNDNLQKVADWIYTAEAGLENKKGEPAWPAKILTPGTPKAIDAITTGVTRTTTYWAAQLQKDDGSPTLANVRQLNKDLTEFEAAQTVINGLRSTSPITSLEAYRTFRDEWNRQMAILHTKGKAISERWASLSGGKADASLADIYKKELDTLSNNARQDLTMLLALTELPEGSDTTSPSGAALVKANGDLKKAIGELDSLKASPDAKRYAELDTRFFKSMKGTDDKVHPRFEVYVQVYDLADALIVKTEPLKTPEGSLGAIFTDADVQHAKASTDADKVRNQEELLGLVIGKTQFAIDASLRAKKAIYAQDALGAMPEKSEAWPEYVSKMAANGPKDNLLRPQIPLITFPEPKGSFNAQYAPDTVAAAVDALEAVTRVTSPATTPSSSAKALDADLIAAKVSTVRKAYDSYRIQYIRYWREETKEDLRLTYKNFNTFATELVAVGEKTIRGSLDDYGKRMAYALKVVGATEDETAVRLGAQLGANATFQQECADVLSRWRELGDDPRIVRRSILNMIPGDFTDKFVVVSAKTNDGFIARYWQGFTREALRVLAADSLNEIDAGLKELAAYQKFPLTLPGDKKDDLPLADVLKARTALERVRGASAGSLASATNAANRSIGAGGNTRDREIDNNLDVLRGTNLLRDKMAYFDQLDRLFAGLPKDTTPLQFTLSVDKSKLTDRTTAISTPFSYMTISVDGKAIGQPSSLIAERADSYQIPLPNAGDLKFDFRAVQTGNPIHSETFAGPWGALRLVLDPNVKSISRDGNKWNIEYTVTADGKKWSLFLILEFKQPIPDVKDWPNPK